MSSNVLYTVEVGEGLFFEYFNVVTMLSRYTVLSRGRVSTEAEIGGGLVVSRARANVIVKGVDEEIREFDFMQVNFATVGLGNIMGVLMFQPKVVLTRNPRRLNNPNMFEMPANRNFKMRKSSMQRETNFRQSSHQTQSSFVAVTRNQRKI